jgi:hypothetical protein
VRAHPGRSLVLGAAALLVFPAYSEDNGVRTGPDAVGPSTAARQIEERLQYLAKVLGPHAAELSEPSAELGHVYLRNGSYAEARSAFWRAMHIERVNTGLYTPRQVPLLDLVIESSLHARDWGQANDDFKYLEWLNYRIHGPQGPELIDALGRVINWHLTAVHVDTETRKGNHLLRLLDLGKRRAMLMERHYGSAHPQHLEQLYQLALYHLYAALAARRGGPVSETLTANLIAPNIRRSSTHLAQEELAEDCYKAGRRLIERAIEAASATSAFTPEAAAVGLVYLADWDLLFNHDAWAEKTYAEAFNMLATAGIPVESLRRFYGTPAVLPVPNFRLELNLAAGYRRNPGDEASATPGPVRFVPWASEVPGIHFPAAGSAGLPTVAASRYALARFRVEENGWVENIRIVEVRPEDGALSDEAREALWYMQFRPRFEDGQAVVTKDMEARYLPLE